MMDLDDLALSSLLQKIQPLVDEVRNHRAFTSITSLENLRKFSESHVYVVWDFMCLLKALQRKLVCTEVVWHPPTYPIGSRLINEIVTEEESDLYGDGRYLSHFEMYIEAMTQAGANTRPIWLFMEKIKEKPALKNILSYPMPKEANEFVSATFKVIGLKTHQIAASFAFARENITDGMFESILNNFSDEKTIKKCSKFIYYFQRHIDLDADKHSEEAKSLVGHLCGVDDKKWQEALETAMFSLESRIKLLDGIYNSLLS